MDINLDVFRKSYLVAGLTDEDVRKVAMLATTVEFRPGQNIVTYGSQDLDVYIIISGSANVMRRGEALLGTCGVGSVIGEVALVDNQPRSATVVARNGNVTCAKIEGQALRKFIFQNKEIGFMMVTNIARILAMRLREASGTIEDLRGHVSDLWLYKDQKK